MRPAAVNSALPLLRCWPGLLTWGARLSGKATAVEVYDRASEWLKDALNPFQSGPVPGFVAARPETRTAPRRSSLPACHCRRG